MFRGKAFARRFHLLALLGVSGIFVCATLAGSFMQAKAANPVNWITNENPGVEKTAVTAPDEPYSSNLWARQRGCINQTVTVVLGFAQEQQATVCITTGQGMRFGIYANYTPVVSFGYDTKMYKLLGASYYGELISGTDTFIDRVGSPPRVTKNIYTDFAARIKRDTHELLYTQYVFNETEVAPAFATRSSAADIPNWSYGSGYSANGKYFAWLSDGENGQRYKLADLSAKTVTTYFAEPYAVDSTTLGYLSDFAVSNDGTYVVSGNGGDLWIWHIESCGAVDIRDNEYFDSAKICSSKHIDREMLGETGSPNYVSYGYQFTDDNGQLSFYAGPSITNLKYVTLTAPGYIAPRLDYLALGDSYSSGEGDIERVNGVSYYTLLTDYKRGCHLSTRSYPFLLQRYWNINPNYMRSVACSGARVVADYYSPISNYYGQEGRLKESKNATQDKILALNDFIPGRIPQLEFVEKYRPSKITFTGGGNDIGFANIVRYCGSSIETCGFASDAEMKNNLKGTIDDQYLYNKAFIKAVQASSPDTKIYMIGYPKFLADKVGLCLLNSGLLDGDEIDMINSSVTRLNDVLRNVAADTGIQYIDIENSLEGGRLCEGSQFVTGFVDVNFDRESQEMFHPNAKGHEKMAEVIRSQVTVPYLATHSQIESSGANRHVRQVGMTEGELTVDKPYYISLPNGTFAAGSLVSAYLHSTSVKLADSITNIDGSLDLSGSFPKDVKLGYHLLSIQGYSPSGESIEVQQFIELMSGIQSDRDADGIPDAIDPCEYITQWFDDQKNNICNIKVAPSVQEAVNDTMLRQENKTSISSRPSKLVTPSVLSSDLFNFHNISPDNAYNMNTRRGDVARTIVVISALIIGLIVLIRFVIMKK